MDSESLLHLSTVSVTFGVFLAGAGGLGLYFYNNRRGGADPKRSSIETELRVQVAKLQKSNDELRRQLELAKPAATPVGGPGQIPAGQRPQPVPVKTAPPALKGWAGETMLEEMIESSNALDQAEPAQQRNLSDRQRIAITGILRKYAGRTIAIHSVARDDLGFNFAWALKAAFVEAGWRVEGVEQVDYANPPAGLFITSGPSTAPEEAIIPHDALTTAGFAVSRCVDSNLKGEKTVLLVGVAAK